MYLYLDAAAEGVKPCVICVLRKGGGGGLDLPLRLFERGHFKPLLYQIGKKAPTLGGG